MEKKVIVNQGNNKVVNKPVLGGQMEKKNTVVQPTKKVENNTVSGSPIAKKTSEAKPVKKEEKKTEGKLRMGKGDLIGLLVKELEIPAKDAQKFYEGMFKVIKNQLKAGFTISLGGIGTYDSIHRDPRTARNPQTGEPIEVGATIVPRFKFSKNFRDQFNLEMSREKENKK